MNDSNNSANQSQSQFMHDVSASITKAFDNLAELVQKEAKVYNSSRNRAAENINCGAQITKHRINL